MAMTQWLPVSRRGAGEYTTSNFTVPSNMDRIRIQLDVAPTDFSTPDLSVTATVEISIDDAQTWIPQIQTKFVGGDEPQGRGGPMGWVAEINGCSIYAGKLARVHFITVGTFRWGLLGEIF